MTVIAMWHYRDKIYQLTEIEEIIGISLIQYKPDSGLIHEYQLR